LIFLFIVFSVIITFKQTQTVVLTALNLFFSLLLQLIILTDVMIQMNKDKDMLENATKEQKGLLQDATRSIRG